MLACDSYPRVVYAAARSKGDAERPRRAAACRGRSIRKRAQYIRTARIRRPARPSVRNQLREDAHINPRAHMCHGPRRVSGLLSCYRRCAENALDSLEPLDPDERAIELTADESITATVASSIIWSAIVA